MIPTWAELANTESPDGRQIVLGDQGGIRNIDVGSRRDAMGGQHLCDLG